MSPANDNPGKSPMKFVSFTDHKKPSWGLFSPEGITDLSALYPDLKAYVRAGCPQLPDLSRAPKIRISDIRYLPVIPNPDKIICAAVNYEMHRAETKREPTKYPSFFVRFANSQTGHEEPVTRPACSTRFDWEGELAVIIGRSGRYIKQADAMSYIAGYACYNDITVRDWQRHTNQFTPGKNFPTTGPFGPVMVTADEIPDWKTLTLTTRVNGEVMQQTKTGEMIFGIPALIEYISTFTELAPGDVILTGTPGGVGDRREPPVYMVEGDVVEIEIEKVGLLRNKIVAEA